MLTQNDLTYLHPIVRPAWKIAFKLTRGSFRSYGNWRGSTVAKQDYYFSTKENAEEWLSEQKEIYKRQPFYRAEGVVRPINVVCVIDQTFELATPIIFRDIAKQQTQKLEKLSISVEKRKQKVLDQLYTRLSSDEKETYKLLERK